MSLVLNRSHQYSENSSKRSGKLIKDSTTVLDKTVSLISNLWKYLTIFPNVFKITKEKRTYEKDKEQHFLPSV